MLTRIRLLVLILGCSAPALWLAIILYVKFTDGWGAFGVAPLFLPLFATNAAVAALGGFVYLANASKRPRDFPLAAVIGVNCIVLWYAATHR